MKQLCGIYCIENNINRKKYIGQSINIYKRWTSHKNNLNGHYIDRGHIKENPHFQNAWDKYGEENFSFYILELCSKELLDDREKYWIKRYKTLDRKYGYNKTEGGQSDPLVTYSKEERSVLLDSENKKTVLTKEQVLEIIERFKKGDYNSNIANDYNVGLATINDIRYHRTWKKYTEGIDLGTSNGKVLGGKQGFSVDMYDKNGNYIKTFVNGVSAEQETGISRKLISAVCHGEKRIAKGYIWRLHGHPFNEYRTEKIYK